MAISQRILVFDFDGTLVDSNTIKREAYFEIFTCQEPVPHIIARTLQRSFEQSRRIIIEEILQQVKTSFASEEADRYVAAYGAIVFDRVAHCPALPGADQLLEALSLDHALYLSSNTPEKDLRKLVDYRGWGGYFQDIFGHPRRKEDTLRAIAAREQADPAELLVVGDGATDRISAQAIGCQFFPVTDSSSLLRLLEAHNHYD